MTPVFINVLSSPPGSPNSNVDPESTVKIPDPARTLVPRLTVDPLLTSTGQPPANATPVRVIVCLPAFAKTNLANPPLVVVVEFCVVALDMDKLPLRFHVVVPLPPWLPREAAKFVYEALAGFPVTVMFPATLMMMVVDPLLVPFDVTPTRAEALDELPSTIKLPPMFTVSDTPACGAQNCHLPVPVLSTVTFPAMFVEPPGAAVFHPKFRLPDQDGQLTVRL